MAKIQRALISVTDKARLGEFGRRLSELDVRIISTEGTGRMLRECGVHVRDLSEYEGLPSFMSGRLSALHPRVMGGVLASRDEPEHLREMAQIGIEPIDMVVVNLYPFVETIAEPNVELMEAVENIEIAGPALIRAAAKNYTHVAVVTSPRQYEDVACELEETGGLLSDHRRFLLAIEAFRHTAHYDAAIADYLGSITQP